MSPLQGQHNQGQPYQEVTNPVTLNTTGMTAPYYTLTVPQIIGEVNAQCEVDYTMNFNRGVIRVESVNAQPMEVHWDVINGKVMFHGKLRSEILYVTGEHYVRDRRDEIISYANFGIIPQAQPGQNVNVYVKVRDISWDVDQHCRVDIHILLDVFITVTQSIVINVPLFSSVSGTVSLNGVSQANAIVILYDPNANLIDWTFTNANGNYTLENVPAGNYTIVAAVSGTYEARPITLAANTPMTANFFQAPSTTCTNILSSSACAFITGQLGAV